MHKDSVKAYSKDVTIGVSTTTTGYHCVVTAKAYWVQGSEPMEASSVREIDLYKAKSLKGVTVEEFIECTKRDSLRELVTNLNLYKVL